MVISQFKVRNGANLSQIDVKRLGGANKKCLTPGWVNTSYYVLTFPSARKHIFAKVFCLTS